MPLIMQPVAASIAVGSHVWVEDPDEAWLDGEVLQVKGEEVTVNCTSGKKVCIPCVGLYLPIMFPVFFYYLACIVCSKDIEQNVQLIGFDLFPVNESYILYPRPRFIVFYKIKSLYFFFLLSM